MTSPKKSRLTWSREPNETGLAGVCQAPRGKILKVNGIVVAHVSPFTVGFHRYDGWYFCARSDELGIPRRNSCCKADGYLVDDIELVMGACENYVRECLAKCSDGGGK